MCRKLIFDSLFLFLVFCSLNISAIAFTNSEISPQIEWETTFGGSDLDEAHSVIETADGGFLLAGYTESYGAGNGDVWLIKTDGNGVMIWNKTFGGSEKDDAKEVIASDDGGYVLAGYTNSYGAGGSDFWLIKTDTSGQEVWNQTFGGAGDEIVGLNSLIQTSDGGYALVGRTDSYGVGGPDVWLVKTDVTGQAEWNHTFGGLLDDRGSSLVQTVDDGYALLAVTESYGGNDMDFWLIETDNTGQAEWNQTFEGAEGSWGWGHSIVRTADGGYALAGFVSGDDGSKKWLLKIDASGNMIWNHILGEGHILDLIQTTDEGYALVGGSDIWFTKVAAGGLVEWKYTLDGTLGGNTFSLIQTADGNYTAAGIASDNADMWLIKVNEPKARPTTTPGFELEVLVFSLALLFFFSRKRKR